MEKIEKTIKSNFNKKLKIIITLTICILSIVAIFLWIKETKTSEKYEAQKKTQARYLSQTSKQLLEKGDRIGALKTALAVLADGKKSDSPLVIEQEAALSQALYSYQDQEYLRANRMEKTTSSILKEGSYNPSGDYYITMDGNGRVYFFSGKDGKCIWAIQPVDLGESVRENFEAYAILNDTSIALSTEKEIWIINYREQTIIKKINLDRQNSYGKDILIAEKDKIALSDGTNNVLKIYNAITGEVENEIKYESFSLDTSKAEINQLIWNTQKDEIIIAASCENGNQSGLVQYSLKTGKYKILSKQETKCISYIDERYIASIQCLDKETDSDSTPGKHYQYCIYDTKKGKRSWKKDILTSSEQNYFQTLLVGKDNEKQLAFCLTEQICLVNPNKKEVLDEVELGLDYGVVGIDQYDDTKLIFGTKNGIVFTYAFALTDNTQQKENVVAYIEREDVQKIAFYANNKTLVQQCGEGNLVFSSVEKDEDISYIEERGKIRNIEYFTLQKGGEKTVYRCAQYRKDNTFDKKLKVTKAGTDETIYEVGEGEENIWFSNMNIAMRDGTPVLCYVKNFGRYSTTGENSKFYMIDLQKKEEIKSFEMSKNDIMDGSILYANDLSKLYILYGPYGEIDLSKEEFEVDENIIWNADGVYDMSLTADDKYLIVMNEEQESDDLFEGYLKIWDVEKKEWKEIDGKKEYNGVLNYSVTVGKQKPVIAVAKLDGSIEFLDVEAGEKISSISCKDELPREMQTCSFFDEDEYYIQLSNHKITMWRVKDAKKIMEQEEEGSGDIIYTDGSDEYFGITSYKRSGARWDDVPYFPICIYKVDENHRFTEYMGHTGAVLSSCAWASFDGNEILWQDSQGGDLKYSKFHTFKELREKAEEILDGESLTQEEMDKYFIS